MDQFVRGGKPWMLVEAKLGDDALNPSLAYFQEKLDARGAPAGRHPSQRQTAIVPSTDGWHGIGLRS